MCERILAQNCQKFDNFNFEFSMSHHNAHYQSYKNAPKASVMKMIFMKKLGVFVMTYLQLDQTDPDNQYWKQKKGR